MLAIPPPHSPRYFQSPLPSREKQMAGGGRGSVHRQPPQQLDLLRKIRAFTRSLVVDISRGRPPVISVDRYRTYCSDTSGKCSCNVNLPYGKEMLSLEKESHARRLDIMLRVLSVVQELLHEGKHLTKRDVYYMYPSVFPDQAAVDRAINDICILFQCSYQNLHVVPVGRGLIMGWLRFKVSGRKVDCIRTPATAFVVPVEDDVEDIVSVARFILIVEKEAVFNRLANDRFCERNCCIVITGRGYPDASTRRFLKLLVEKLSIPVYFLVDCDPYGFEILITYRFGSLQMAFDSKLLSLPHVEWIGVLPSDLDAYRLPDRCLLPLTPRDKLKAEAMLKRCYLYKEVPQWRLELELMLVKGVKFEIEALSVTSFSFLSETYLPAKIQGLRS